MTFNEESLEQPKGHIGSSYRYTKEIAFVLLRNLNKNAIWKSPPVDTFTDGSFVPFVHPPVEILLFRERSLFHPLQFGELE